MSAREQILTADFVFTMDAENRVIRNGAVLVTDDRIGAAGDLEAITRSHPTAPVRRMPDRLLLPGLINAHYHSGILRGTAESLPVWDWLSIHINPMHLVLKPHEAEAASWLCYASLST